jgi:hypothetical protein
MSFNIPIRRLLDFRGEAGDQVICDFLSLATIGHEPGFVGTDLLREHWRCSQPTVSRRIHAIAAAGLVDITPMHGGYHIHDLSLVRTAA